ncbi:hypothetical protein [Nocardia fluminea]|uniref:hypothetical protein n=1 Tax=Nocardia fluminea TaxID=134984 RepID=UPI003D0E598A
MNVPIGLAALAIGARSLPSPPAAGGPLPDLLGAGALIGAVGSLILVVVHGPEWGWSSTGVLAAFGVAMALGVVFAVSSARHHSPIVDPALLRVPNFVLARANSLVFQIAFAGMLLSVTLWAQNVWGWSALRTGLAIAPGPLVVPGDLPPQRFATGSGVLSTARQLGLALGVALLGTPDTPAAALDAFQRAWYVTAAIAVHAGLIGFAVRTRSQAGPAVEPPGHAGPLSPSSPDRGPRNRKPVARPKRTVERVESAPSRAERKALRIANDIAPGSRSARKSDRRRICRAARTRYRGRSGSAESGKSCGQHDNRKAVHTV